MNIQQLTDRSYAPYSGDKAACIVEDQKGNRYPGIRIENVSFPLTITAVQSALFNCISEGAKPQKIYLSDTLKDHAEYWLKEYCLETFDVEALRDKELYLPPKSLEMPILQMLKKLHERSQIEHSNFPVSALIETESGYYAG
ncbi:MAG: hypothetical protein R3211_09420, partial [Balneolaceae bacterium]|nr:hypothetical protein [Balneolaceae bacterium]